MTETVSVNSIAYVIAHVSLLMSILIVVYGTKKVSEGINRMLTQLWELQHGLKTIMHEAGEGRLATGSKGMETDMSRKEGGKE